MPIGDAIKFGILRTRDLVELYYGARMVVSVNYGAANVSNFRGEVLKQDPRRIRYEIVATENSGAGVVYFALGSPSAIDDGLATSYALGPAGTIVIARDWRSDMEAVCLPISSKLFSGALNLNFRETFLTPAPVDEIP